MLTAFAAKAEYILPEEADVYRQAIQDTAEQKWDFPKIIEGNGVNTVLNKYLLWQRMLCPSAKASFYELTEFIKDNPSWPQLQLISKNAETAINQDVDTDDIRLWFKMYPPLTTNGMITYAKILKADGKEQEYRDLIRKTWLESDFSFSEEKAFLQKYKKILRNKDHAKRFNRLLWNRRLVQAKSVLKLLKGEERKLAEARYALATKNKPSKALAALPPKLQVSPEVLYERVRYRRGQNDYSGMIKLIKKPSFGKGGYEAKWWNEMYRATLYLLDKGKYTEAYHLVAHHPFPKGSTSYPQAEWISGWIALRFNKKPDTALKHFTALQKNVSKPISKAKALYWLGRTYEAKKMPEEAKKYYRKAAAFITSFYGQLAAEKVNPKILPPLPNPPKVSPEQQESLQNNELIQTLTSLENITSVPESKTLAIRTFYTLKTAGEVKELAKTLDNLNRPDIIVPIARAARQKNMEIGSIGYPRINIPEHEEVEEALVLAIIRQESSFNPKAVSPVGAHGMMQIMPSLAQKISGDTKYAFKKERLLTDKDYNIKLGIKHLEQLLKTYKGYYIPVIAAYNAGEPAVNRWRKLRGDIWQSDDDDKIIDWIEFIPYEETRNYVQRVLENLYMYRRLIKKQSPIGKWDNHKAES